MRAGSVLFAACGVSRVDVFDDEVHVGAGQRASMAVVVMNFIEKLNRPMAHPSPCMSDV
jgi:hypothetical protein